jgi:hypothetical protein
MPFGALSLQWQLRGAFCGAGVLVCGFGCVRNLVGVSGFYAGIPHFAFVLHAPPFGVLAFALASALCLRASSVAPVRGDA